VTNSIKMELRRIEPPRTGPIKRPYYIGIYPVTQRQYEEVMKENFSSFSSDQGGGPDNPVENVNYNKAVKFCEALSKLDEEKKAGRVYRVPTEAEWEFSCRAGTTTKYHSGNDEEHLAEVGWYKKNSQGKTQPVGKKKPNAWGLYDMHGNVWQWCSDTITGKDMKDRHPLRGGAYNMPAEDCTVTSRNLLEPGEQSNSHGFRVVCEIREPK
jgi:formylglycine-generating enzyme required for sulfatase activity